MTAEDKQVVRMRVSGGWWLALIVVVILGGSLRTAGLFRGVDEGAVFHPDVPKQVDMLREYLAGNPVRYRDSWFYDGYPYGLNVVDAAIIRSSRAVARPLRDWFASSGSDADMPSLSALHRWGLVLRAMYGVLTILLVFAAVRRFGCGPGPALVAAALCALAPLGATVTHAITGDVGVDLFLAVALWCAASHARTRHRAWLASCGLACGAAFACKYQGALALWIPAAGVLLSESYRAGWWRRVAADGAAALLGFIAGAVVLLPAFWVSPSRAWQDMLLNFARIKNYNAPEGYASLSVSGRLGHGLGENLPSIAQSLGWGLCALGVLAATGLAVAWLRARRKGEADAPGWQTSVVLFPVLALLASTMLKPSVQPFHFSYLVPVLAVATGLLLARTPAGVGRGVLGVVLLLSAGEALWVQRQELFFWRRAEICRYGERFGATVLERPASAAKPDDVTRALKLFHLEPARLSVFRNRASAVGLRDAPWWTEQHQLPVPTVAWPHAESWMFLAGPVFPRSDREVLVPASGPKMPFRGAMSANPDDAQAMVFSRSAAGRWMTHDLVLRAAPDRLRVGVRSGRWPARYDVEVGGERQHGMLKPHAQAMLEFERPRVAFACPGGAGRPASAIVTCRARAQLGPVWMTVLQDDRERDTYLAFGPDAAAPASMLPADELQRRLDDIRYIESAGPVWLDPEPRRIRGDGHPLAAGVYTLDAAVSNTGAVQDIHFALQDKYGLPSGVPDFEATVEPGLQRVSWTLAKGFVPYDADLMAWCDVPGLTIERWTLKPEGHAMAQWPASCPPAAATGWQDGVMRHDVDVRFPGVASLRAIGLPARVAPGGTITYTTRWELDAAISHSAFHDAVVFLHLKNPEGRTVAELDYPLRQAAFADDRMVVKRLNLPSALTPGTYALYGGLYDSVTRHRYQPRVDAGVVTKGESVRLAELDVTP